MADKKANVAMTKQDSIFPNIHLPGGISSKATEYKELALKGDSWESPIFKLGSASASSDVPHAQEVRRKQHSVTSGGVRGPQNVGNTSSMTNQLHDPSSVNAGTSGSGMNNSSAGYSNVGNGHATGTGAGYGNGSIAHNTSGFSNQVDQAFSKDTTTGPELNKSNGNTYNTTLGANNPVMTGRN